MLRTQCIPHPELPGTSALFSDYLYQFSKLSAFYRYDPNDPESVRSAAASATIPDERRARVVRALRRINGPSASLDALGEPGTVAVVTGQQVSLFGGPAYTLYKALTAVKLARQLTDHGIRAVPVFWLATEDHDLAEADHCWAFGPDQQPHRLNARVRGLAGQPVGPMVLDGVPLDELRATLAGLPFADEVTERAAAAYRPGRSMGEAFRLLLADLLSNYGLVFFDPLDLELREAASPLLVRALEETPALSHAVIERGKQLKAAGYHTQVLFEEQSSLLMRFEAGRRISLRRHDGAYYHDTRRYETAELAADPSSLSPNALLRSVMQDYLLPTAAYVGGPAEIAYFAQSEAIYAGLQATMPVIVPRSGFTLLDERGYSQMTRYGLGLKDCLQPEDALRERIAARLIPAPLDQLFITTGASIDESAERLRAALEAFDPTLGLAMTKSAAKIRYQLEKNRHKVAREALRREDQVERGVAHLSGLLYPERHLQERLYSFLPFLAKYGLDLIETLYEHTYRDCPDHLLMTL